MKTTMIEQASAKVRSPLATTLHVLVFLLLITSNYLIFVVAPAERVMGNVQRIFYFHVGSAFATYTGVLVLFCAGLWFLASNSVLADLLMEASGEIALLFATIVLFTGIIWGHAAWNVWFSWEPRLVSFLCLWLMLLSFNFLRLFSSSSSSAYPSAVLAILCAVSVPLVIYSIRLLPDFAQLHPRVIERQGLRDARYWWTFGLSCVTLVLFTASLIIVRLRVALAELRTILREVQS